MFKSIIHWSILWHHTSKIWKTYKLWGNISFQNYMWWQHINFSSAFEHQDQQWPSSNIPLYWLFLILTYMIYVYPILVVYRTYTKCCDSKWIHGGVFEDVPQGLTHLIADKFLEKKCSFFIFMHILKIGHCSPFVKTCWTCDDKEICIFRMYMYIHMQICLHFFF